MEIEILGNDAAHGEGKDHFSMLMHNEGKTVWIEPSAPISKLPKDGVDAIFVCDADEDGWRTLDKYIEKFEDTPIYSTGSVISELEGEVDGDLNTIEHAKTLIGTKFNILKTTPEPRRPSCGFEITVSGKRIIVAPELPNYLSGSLKRNMGYTSEEATKEPALQSDLWIVGVGNYERPKSNDHKLTFKELVKFAKEAKPKKIYLINIRDNISDNKSAIEDALSEFNGKVLSKGDTIDIGQSISIKSLHTGLYMAYPLPQLIAKGKTSKIITGEYYDIQGKYLLLDENKAYGYISLKNPEPIISWSEFFDLGHKHNISIEYIIENKDWNKLPLWSYDIDSVDIFDQPKQFNFPREGCSLFLTNAENYIEEELDIENKIKDWTDYDAESRTNAQLADDWRLLISAVSKKIDWGEW